MSQTITVDKAHPIGSIIEDICCCQKLSGREILLGIQDHRNFKILAEATFYDYYTDPVDDFYHRDFIDHAGGYDLREDQAKQTGRKFYFAEEVTN